MTLRPRLSRKEEEANTRHNHKSMEDRQRLQLFPHCHHESAVGGDQASGRIATVFRQAEVVSLSSLMPSSLWQPRRLFFRTVLPPSGLLPQRCPLPVVTHCARRAPPHALPSVTSETLVQHVAPLPSSCALVEVVPTSSPMTSSLWQPRRLLCQAALPPFGRLLQCCSLLLMTP